MIPINDAKKIVQSQCWILDIEKIPLAQTVNRVLAQEICADMNLPPFDRSQMDGFALITEDVENPPVKLKVIGESIAGKSYSGTLNRGEAVRIMTGARVPAGADAVQKVELTAEIDGLIEVFEKTKVGQNINFLGSEIKENAFVFDAGEIIKENMIAAIASFGYSQVKVYRKPRVAILSTGSEIVGIDETPGKDQIRNSNSIMLKVFSNKFSDAEILPHVADDFESLCRVIKNAAEKFDVLITTGGVSVGDYDFTKKVFRQIGAQIFFEKISLKPGKPTVFAKKNDCFIFGLPGNPVSAAVTFQLFVRPALMKMQGAKNYDLKKGFAVCGEKLKAANKRDSVLPVSLTTDPQGKLVIESVRFNGSSNFIAFARADALVFIPERQNLEAGDAAEIFYL